MKGGVRVFSKVLGLSFLVRILSAPGMLIQRLTTREPDKSMIEVAIASVDAVFDWKKFLQDNFGYDLSQLEEDTGSEEKAGETK